VQQVLRRRGFVVPIRRSRQPAEGWRLFVRPYPNDLWHIDATCHRLANGRPFWVIDLIDDHSRFLLAAHVCVSPTCETGWAALRQAVAGCGLPRQLLSDNGLNFTGRLHHVTVAFERQVRAAGIEFIHARPQHPETIGKLERQHRTQNDWIADHGAPRSLTAAQVLLDAYRLDYNTARPHEAIGQHFPAELYEPGQPIELPAVELAPADPYPPGCLKRRVDISGRVDYARTAFPLDRRWAGITIGLIRRGAYLEAYYGAALIDTFIVGDLPEPTPRGRRPKTN
jgi:transposase InsO family protein